MRSPEDKKIEEPISFGTDIPESQARKIETAPETREKRPLYETTRKHDRFMEYALEDLERDAINKLRQIEEQSGMSPDVIEKTRGETGVLGDLAEAQADAKAAEIYAKEGVEQNIFDAFERNVTQGSGVSTQSASFEKQIKPSERERKLYAEAPEELQGYERNATPEKSFDPQAELKQILKAKSSERSGLLREWRERFAAYRISLAQVQEEIIEIIREDPDVFTDEDTRSSLLSAVFQKYKISTREFTQMSYMTMLYAKKHTAVRKFRTDHPDDQELFFAAFGTPPKGPVEVIKGPMTLYFRCHDERDYALIYSQKFLKGANIEQGDVEAANMSGGTSIGSALVGELRGAIIAENARGTRFEDDAKKTYVHEEQHAINGLFGDRLRPMGGYRFHKFLRSERGGEREGTLREYLRDLRDANLEHAKDEVIAYFKDGRKPQEIFDLLIRERGIYDYFAPYFRTKSTQEQEGEAKTADGSLHRFLAGHLGSEEELPENMDEIMADVFRVEYKKILGSAIVSYLDLRDRGLSDEQLAAIFLQEPLPKWRKTVDRLLSSTSVGVVRGRSAHATEELEAAHTNHPIDSEDVGTWNTLNFKQKIGTELSARDARLLEDIEIRASRELDELIGPNFRPRAILTDKKKRKEQMEFLEKWNTLSDDAQCDQMARADRLLRMEDWGEHELRVRKDEIRVRRQFSEKVAFESMSRIMSEAPLTRDEEATYCDFLTQDPNTLTLEMTEDFFKLRRRLQMEQERIIGPGAPKYGNRDMAQNRIRGPAYYAFLREWEAKSPEAKQVVLRRLGELEQLLGAGNA